MRFEFKKSALASTAEIFHEAIVSFETKNGRLPRQARDRSKRISSLEKRAVCFRAQLLHGEVGSRVVSSGGSAVRTDGG